MDRRKTEGQGKYGLVRHILKCWRHSKTHDPRLFFFVAEEEALYVRSSGAEDKSITMLSPGVRSACTRSPACANIESWSLETLSRDISLS
jgi:hypothetical protein